MSKWHKDKRPRKERWSRRGRVWLSTGSFWRYNHGTKWWHRFLGGDEWGQRTVCIPVLPWVQVILAYRWCNCHDCAHMRAQTALWDVWSYHEDHGCMDDVPEFINHPAPDPDRNHPDYGVKSDIS